jgi:hypothetical protein
MGFAFSVSPRELIARICAILRRSGWQSDNKNGLRPPKIKSGDLELDLGAMSNRQTIGCKRAGGYPVTLGHRAHAPIWSRYGVRGDHDYQISGVTLLSQLRSRTTVSETAVPDLYLIKVETMDPTTAGTSKNKREAYPASNITAACNLLERVI